MTRPGSASRVSRVLPVPPVVLTRPPKSAAEEVMSRCVIRVLRPVGGRRGGTARRCDQSSARADGRLDALRIAQRACTIRKPRSHPKRPVDARGGHGAGSVLSGGGWRWPVPGACAIRACLPFSVCQAGRYATSSGAMPGAEGSPGLPQAGPQCSSDATAGQQHGLTPGRAARPSLRARLVGRDRLRRDEAPGCRGAGPQAGVGRSRGGWRRTGSAGRGGR